jgi:murein DD-endopeptidase MepM/ murein hydrolase activator NlpD
LRKSFLMAPLKTYRISSKFQRNRFHPVQKRWKAHKGTDFAAPRGTPIMSTANGTVIKASYTSGNGNYVKVKHNGKYTTQYLHMTKFAKGIKSGKFVKQGEVIGYVGSTGLATGPHVCYRFWVNGIQVDPYKQKLPDAEPIKKEYVEAFEKRKSDLIQLKDSVFKSI